MNTSTSDVNTTSDNNTTLSPTLSPSASLGKEMDKMRFGTYLMVALAFISIFTVLYYVCRGMYKKKRGVEDQLPRDRETRYQEMSVPIELSALSASASMSGRDRRGFERAI